MTAENACFQLLLLNGGIEYEYRRWINELLETEKPLSSATLELSFIGDDTKNAAAFLYGYCREKDIDTERVCTRLRLFLRDEYFSGRITRTVCVKVMKTASEFVGYWEKPSWHRMNLVASFPVIHDWLSDEQMEVEFEKTLRQYLETGYTAVYSV